MDEKPTLAGEATKIMLTVIGTAVSSVGLMIALHAHFILPATLHQVRAVVRDEIKMHEQNPHPTSVPREVFNAHVLEVNKTLQGNAVRLESIELLLRRIEKEVK